MHSSHACKSTGSSTGHDEVQQEVASRGLVGVFTVFDVEIGTEKQYVLTIESPVMFHTGF